MNKKITIPFLFFILVYFNQGFSGLPGQCIYYLTREHWKLSATTLGMIGFITSLAWYIKPFFGVIIDRYGKNRTKQLLYFTYISLLLLCGYIVIYGLNLFSLILTTTLMNFCIGFNDVTNDTVMCKLEKKYNLNGRLQSLQWSSLGVAGLLVSIFGALIADKFDINIGYRVAYAITMIVPLITLIYLKYNYQESEQANKKLNFSKLLSIFKNKQFLFAILFIASFQLTPSFGTALMIKMREELHIDKMFIGFLGATGTVLGIIGYVLYYWKFHKFNMTKMLYFTVIFSAITNLFYLYIPNQWYLLLYNILFGTIGGITFLTILAFYAKITPNNAEGMIYALITSISNLCGHLSGVTGGIIFDYFGYNATVIVSTVTTLLCLFLIPKLNKESNV